MFMASSGGLKAAGQFRGRDSILSGPAGGVVGVVETLATPWGRTSWGSKTGGESLIMPVRMPEDSPQYIVRTEPGTQADGVTLQVLTARRVEVATPILEDSVFRVGVGSLESQRKREGAEPRWVSIWR